MIIKSANYLTSATRVEDILKDDMLEIAFVGRSNVGKSSLINALTGRKCLAKASSTPGLTKMINYFLVNNLFKIVDLPGYGYAKTGQQHIANWAGLMEKYLSCSQNLRVVFVLLDCRVKPSQLDQMMLDFLQSQQIPYVVVMTKVDKLAKTKISQAADMISRELKIRKELIFPVSAATGFGKEKILDYIETIINV